MNSRWDGRDWQGFLPTPKTHEAALAQWVTEGVLLPANPTETFKSTGVPICSPPPARPPPEGMLSLVTIDEDWWNAIGFQYFPPLREGEVRGFNITFCMRI